MTLTELGWHPFFDAAFQSLPAAERHTPFRVIRQDKTRYRILGEAGERTALLPGRLLHDPDADRPAVGDWVSAEPLDDDETAIIHAVLLRRSGFVRHRAGRTTEAQVVAANVDTVFLVAGLDGDFNLRRIERYVTQAWNSGATPVLLLNKADACPDAEARREAAEAVAMGVAVHLVSAKTGDGLGALGPYFGLGRTVAFLGSSGVGKSSLVNRLLGHDVMATAGVREDDSRGRHTTTHRQLFPLPTGGLVLDTPGMRELQLWASGDDLDTSFADIDALAASCRFRDCAHEAEPGCAVRAALEEGLLDAGRYASYQKLKRELAYLARQQDEMAARKEHERVKKFSRMVRDINRHNRKRR